MRSFVTNKIEGCLDFINYRKSVSASEYQPQLNQILEITLYCFDEFHYALRAFFEPKGRVEAIREHCRAVVQRESEIDDLQRSLTLRIYQSSRDLAEKQHLTEMLVRIARISDRMENTADEQELVSLKSII